MAVTVTNREFNVIGRKRAYTFDAALDSSYAFGGESLTPQAIGLSVIEKIILETVEGYQLSYDYTNNKIKAYAPAPPVVFEEAVTVTANVGTLKYPAAYIMYVGVANEGFKVIPGALTPVTKSVAVSEAEWGTRNTLTFLAADAVTTCYVTYITQAWKDVFDNLVHAQLTAGARVSGHADLLFTAGSPDVITLGELAVAIQNVTWSDAGVIKPMKALYKSETAATTEVAVDFSDTGDVSLSVLETDTMDAAADSVYITYVKKPSTGFLADRFVEEDDLTPSTDVITVSSGTVFGSNALLYGTCGDFPGATLKYANLIRSGGTLGVTATLAQPTTINNAANTFALGSDHADGDHLKPSYIVGNQWEIPELVQLEVPNGYDLSNVSIKVMAIGY